MKLIIVIIALSSSDYETHELHTIRRNAIYRIRSIEIKRQKELAEVNDTALDRL